MNRRLVNKVSKGPLCQIKITLKCSEPSIWRRVVVPAQVRLDELHDIIQAAMGWKNCHLHEFQTGKGRTLTHYGEPEPEYGDRMLDERGYTLADLAGAARQKIDYLYDFGDSWQHEVLVEKFLPTNPELKQALCLAGANACPPEDSGSLYGYYEKLRILGDPADEEHEHIKEWMGGTWDPALFNIDDVNARLKQFRLR